MSTTSYHSSFCPNVSWSFRVLATLQTLIWFISFLVCDLLVTSQNLLTREHLGTTLGFHCALLYKGVFIPFSYTAQQPKDECSGGLENLWFSLRVPIAPDDHAWIHAGQSSVSNTGCAWPCCQRSPEHSYCLVHQRAQSRRENTHPVSPFLLESTALFHLLLLELPQYGDEGGTSTSLTSSSSPNNPQNTSNSAEKSSRLMTWLQMTPLCSRTSLLLALYLHVL